MLDKLGIKCRICPNEVILSHKTYLKYRREGKQPLCGDCRKFAYRIIESEDDETDDSIDNKRLSDNNSNDASRKKQTIMNTHVATLKFKMGKGLKGHQFAPLAKGKIIRMPPKS